MIIQTIQAPHVLANSFFLDEYIFHKISEEDLLEFKSRLIDGSYISPFLYPSASIIAMLKEKIVLEWPKGRSDNACIQFYSYLRLYAANLIVHQKFPVAPNSGYSSQHIRKTSAGCRPCLQTSAEEEVDQTSAGCKKKTVCKSSGSDPHSVLLEHQSIQAMAVKRWGFAKIILFDYAFAKAVGSVCDAALNQPSVPTLVDVKWASWLRQSSFIIDWLELHFQKMANGSLCVTKAMQRELEQVWGIK
ncbi:hypothetical protein QVD17_30454 [Tagetes erecta]|uniref:UBL3-like ubiquitin domain-containing protein n=1 Tax=Tagetes erecta TaxID=13708 RepID=A0AAD8K2Q2_TARER|nr:hypothetical protein QVD17_30454 [Tagetes erecta]